LDFAGVNLGEADVHERFDLRDRILQSQQPRERECIRLIIRPSRSVAVACGMPVLEATYRL
jgi:hypothetical protein